jgi:hypothetical protein
VAIAYVAFAFALLRDVDVIAPQFGWPESERLGITLVLAAGFIVTLVLAWYHGEKSNPRSIRCAAIRASRPRYGGWACRTCRKASRLRD